MRTLIVIVCCLIARGAAAQSLVIKGLPNGDAVLNAEMIEKLGPIEITDAREISNGATKDRIEVTYRGIQLPRLLDANGFDKVDRRLSRHATVSVVSRDGYRATFSWGELFNTVIGQRVIVVTGEKGPATDPKEGPFSVRALSDLRSGPRHVRDVVEIQVNLPK